VNFEESEAYLFSLGNEVETMKLGLEKIRTLLAALDDPHEKYKKVQVAGTNGKGSVCAFLNSICLEAGITTGVYTSPHLVSITERIKINGEDISEEAFARIASFVRGTSEGLVERGDLETVPTYFEQVTAIALVAFAEANVELAILETGLGGRFDATTAANAEIAAITKIDLDHQEYLGDTIEEIAAEKAAIIREGSIVIVGEQCERALKVILDRCTTVGVAPVLSSEILADVVDRKAKGACVVFTHPRAHPLSRVLPPLCLGLAGAHQIGNAKVAVLLVEEIQKHFPIVQRNIVDGLENARHPGRLERVGKFLLDGAHNPGGARALRAYLDEFVHEPIILIFGVMKDKDVAKIAETLFPVASQIILTRPSNSRAMTAEKLADLVSEQIGDKRVATTGSVDEALSIAKELTSPDGVILVTGSLYMVGEARNLLNN
jgi:dihydrofolate synthase/folylpolyglutamate synthase